MADYTKKPTNQGRYSSPQKSQYQQSRSSSYNSNTKSEPVKPSSSSPVASKNSVENSLAQLTQQFNLLLVLFVALFLFNMFMYWKMRNLEAGGVTTAAQQQQQAAPAPQTEITQEQLDGLFADGNIVLGDKNAKLKFVEFSDPSCPFCHVASGKNPELSEQMDPSGRFKPVSAGGTYVPPVEEFKRLVDEGKAAFVWLYANGHGNGNKATEAIYCAHEKDLFWPVHDKLMTNAGYTLINDQVKNDKANEPLLVDFLSDVIDPTFMTDCLASGKYADRPTKDQETATSVGVSGTPGFFVNTKNYAGAYSFTDMQADVDAALQ